MAAIALQAANRYNKALQKSLHEDGAPRPDKSALVCRWSGVCQEHATAEQEYCQPQGPTPRP